METYLERSTADAKASIRSDLASVTAPGANVSTLENAIQTAHRRLDQVDTTQRNALARLNRHVSDLAASMDQRLSAENQDRKAVTAELDAKITSVRNQIGQVETETAAALEAVGEKVTEFAAVLENRSKTSDSATAERLADLAKENKTEFAAAQSEITARLEALEVIASAWSPSDTTATPMANPYLPANEDNSRIDQMGETIASLQEELSRMHARIATVQHAAPNANIGTAPPSSAAPTNILPMAAAPSQVQSPSPSQVQDNPYETAAKAIESSAAETAAAEPETPAPSQNKTPRESHVPVEFDPASFTPSQEPLPVAAVQHAAPYASASFMPPVPQAPTPPTPPTPPQTPLPPLAPPMASTGSHSPVPQNMPDFQAEDPFMQAPKPVSTYDDPAYAEGNEMRAERVGAIETRRSKRPKLSTPKLPISGRNLRVGGLALGVAVVGLFAAKTILGGTETGSVETGADAVRTASISSPSESLTSQNQSQSPNLGTPDSRQSPSGPASSAKTSSPSAPTAPLGQYAETKAPSLSAGAETTLDAAVEAGNPIAQFQKGLAQLQSGQMEEGARLIRLSANRNQPAAQYRLAKLYETGTGLAKDEITARELIERAAIGGNRIAMHDLGNYHAYGQGGLQQNIGAALDWFTKAAERGVVDSQFNVAFLREGNEGIPADIETAYFWYLIAARQGDQGAPDRIAVLETQIDAAAQAEIKARANSFKPKPVDEAANGVFRNVAWAKPVASAAKAKSAQILKIRDAQTLLGQLGYPVGTPDGVSGAKTRDAVKSFEAVNGLPETGQITDDLIERLEIATGA